MYYSNFFNRNSKYNKNPHLFGFLLLKNKNEAPRKKNSYVRELVPVSSESGMATAEYAIVTLAAVGLAGLLIVILSSDEVRNFLVDIIHKALSGF